MLLRRPLLPGQARPTWATTTVAGVRRAPAAAAVAASPAAPAVTIQRLACGRRPARPARPAVPAPPSAVPPASADELPAGTAFTRVVAPSALALALCNIDRICLAVAIVPIAAEFGWGPAVQVSCSARPRWREGHGRATQVAPHGWA